MRYLITLSFLMMVIHINQVHASEWVFVFENDEQLEEFDRSSIQPSDGYKFVRRRVTFKKQQDYKTESGALIKYLTIGTLYSCTEKTETTSLVYKYSVDKKLVSKHEIKGMVERAKPGSISEKILKQVCTHSELEAK